MKIKNWSKFQHFKDRRPPWIKLYRDILDDIDWHMLDPLASKVLVMCWLIASEEDGNIPDIKTLAFRLRMTEKQTSECISKLSHWLEQDDINVISERYQDDAPETETETETERETKKEKKATDVAFFLPDWIPSDTWDAYIAMRKSIKKPATEYAKSLIVKKLERFKSKGQDVKAVLEKSITSGWQDVFEIKEDKKPTTFAQQAADIARTTVPAVNKGPDPALLKIEADRQKAVPMPDHIRKQIMSVVRKV